MSIRPPPRYTVHPVNAPPARSRWWPRWALALAWTLSLVLVAGLAFYLGHRKLHTEAADGPLTVQQLTTENAHLKQQLAIAQRSVQISNVASRKLTDSLADRDEQINGLRADLAFYSRLVGGSSQQGLQLQTVHLQRVAKSRAWNVVLTLTRNAHRGDEVEGTAQIDVDGVRNGVLARLHWQDISAPGQKQGLNFKFKYFQQLHGTIMLPGNFTPNRLHIRLTPRGRKTIIQDMSWTDALSHSESNHVE